MMKILMIFPFTLGEIPIFTSGLLLHLSKNHIFSTVQVAVSRALRTAAAAAPCFARAPAGWGASRTPRVNGRLLYVVLWILRLTQVVFCIPMWYNTTPSEKSWSESQLGLLLPIYGKIKFMFQTTNQYGFYGLGYFSVFDWIDGRI